MIVDLKDFPKSKALLFSTFKKILIAMQNGFIAKANKEGMEIPEVGDAVVNKYMDLSLSQDSYIRLLYDFFDSNKVFISINRSGSGFAYTITNEEENGSTKSGFNNRLETEKDAFASSFRVLENKLQ